MDDNEDNDHVARALKIFTLEHDPLNHAMDNGTPYPMPTSPLDDHNICIIKREMNANMYAYICMYAHVPERL